MKYVRFTDEWLSDCIIVFSSSLNHNQTIERIRHETIVSAGFVSFDCDGGLRCFGRSESLDLESNPEKDTALLLRQMNA